MANLDGLPPDTDAAPAIYTVLSVLLFLSILCVALRIYLRLSVLHSFGWDDGLIIAAMVQAILAAAFIYLAVGSGLGRHAVYIGAANAAAVVKWNTAYVIAYIPGLNTVKLSICVLILRLQNHRIIRYIVWVVMVLMTIANLATTIFYACQCLPIQKLWEPQIAGTCAPNNAVFIIGYIQSGFSVTTDLFCTLSPVFVLWKVQIKTTKKIAVCGLMSLGLAATLCNGLRNLWYGSLQVSDYSHAIIPILFVTMLELFLGIIAACLPVVTPVNFRENWRNAWSAKRAGSDPRYPPIYATRVQAIGVRGQRPSGEVPLKRLSSSDSDGPWLAPTVHVYDKRPLS